MDCYFLKIKITEFIYNSNGNIVDNIYEYKEKETKTENKDEKYEIEFELQKSGENYILEIINDNKGNKIPFSNYFTLLTNFKVNKNLKGNIEYDYLEILLYIKNGDKENNRKLIDIDKGKLIDEKCINTKKYYELNLGKFLIKFSYKLLKFEDLYNLEENENLLDNNFLNEYRRNNEDNNKEKEYEKNIIEKYHDMLTNKKGGNDIIYDDCLFEEIEPIEKDEENNSNSSFKKGVYHKINSNDFFDINVDIFEEEENEEEEENNSLNEEKNPFEPAFKNSFKKIYRNTNLSSYELIHLEQPILKEITKENLIECFLIAGLSQSKKIINNSESFLAQCKHKNCEFNNSYYSQIFFRLQKPNSIFEEIDSNLISNLIFPNGIKICFGDNFFNNFVKNRNILKFKNTEFSFNVLTDLNGKRYYIYSLIFFIKFEFQEFIEFYKDYGDIKGINTNKFNISDTNIFIPFSFSLISKIFDIEKFNIILNDLFISFKTNEINSELFDNELVHLIFEIPFPPLNSKFKIFLPNSQIEIYSSIYENKNYKNINIFNILFEKYFYNINFIVKIFILLLLEKKIIIHSSKHDKIFLTIESLLTLIYPLNWVNTYIPLIPEENTNLILQSFLPFIVGISHQLYFNYANKIENLNNNNNEKAEQNWDNIFTINLDTENILPTNTMNEIIDKCPIVEFIENEYLEAKNNGELNNDTIKKIFLDAILQLIGDVEKFTSKLGENILFNQKIFLWNKSKKYEQFYKEITSTQQFYQFINDFNIGVDNLYYEEFREKIKTIKNRKRIKKNKREKEIILNDYYLYPYFFKKNKDLESDLFNLEDETDLYYNCLDMEDEINYLLESEAFIRIKLILKNYIPENLRKYEINNENKSIFKKNDTRNSYKSNNDSNLSLSELENDKLESIKNVFDNLYGKVKTSINRIIPRMTSINNNENKENITSNIQNNGIRYRHRNSLIKMIKENNNKKELMKYKEQIIDLLKDYMGYILSNQNMDIVFTLDELSKLLKYRRIRREFSKILLQKKFEKNIEHELSEETFELLYNSVFFALTNMNDNKNEYKILRRIIKSLFYYFHKRKKGIGKIYLYQKFLEKNEKFYFKKSLNFWKYYYEIEIIENNENNDIKCDEKALIDKIKNQMFLLDVDDEIVNFFE